MKYQDYYKSVRKMQEGGMQEQDMQMPQEEMGNNNPACMAIQQALPQLPEDLKAGAEQAIASGQCEQFIQMLQQQAEKGSHDVEMQEGMPMAKFGARFGKPLEEIEYGKKIGRIGLYEIAKAQKGAKKRMSKMELVSYIPDYEWENFQEMARKKGNKMKKSDVLSYVGTNAEKLPPRLFYKYLLQLGVDKEKALIKSGLRTEENLMTKLFGDRENKKKNNTYYNNKMEDFTNVNTKTEPEIINIPTESKTETKTEIPKEKEASLLSDLTNMVKEGALKTASEDDQEQYFLKQMYENDEIISEFTDAKGTVYEKAIPDPQIPGRYKKVFVRKDDKSELKKQNMPEYKAWATEKGVNNLTKEDILIGEISEYAVRLGIDIDESVYNLPFEQKLVFLDTLKKRYEEMLKQNENKKDDKGG